MPPLVTIITSGLMFCLAIYVIKFAGEYNADLARGIIGMALISLSFYVASFMKHNHRG